MTPTNASLALTLQPTFTSDDIHKLTVSPRPLFLLFSIATLSREPVVSRNHPLPSAPSHLTGLSAAAALQSIALVSSARRGSDCRAGESSLLHTITPYSTLLLHRVDLLLGIASSQSQSGAFRSETSRTLGRARHETVYRLLASSVADLLTGCLVCFSTLARLFQCPRRSKMQHYDR